MYDKGGCRCRICTEAHRLATAEQRGNRPDMSLQNALNELINEQKRISEKADTMARALENLQNLSADIGHAIKTIQAVMENQVSVGEQIVVEDVEREDPEPPPMPAPPSWLLDTEAGTKVEKLPSKFRCDLCRCNFMNQKSLDNHNEAHHSENPEKKKRPSPWRNHQQKKPTCPYCKKLGRPKTFDSPSSLEDHIALKHPDKLQEDIASGQKG
jgi:hypothetical protein